MKELIIGAARQLVIEQHVRVDDYLTVHVTVGTATAHATVDPQWLLDDKLILVKQLLLDLYKKAKKQNGEG